MRTILAIAANTFRENRRDRILYVLVLFAAAIILAGIVAGEMFPWEQQGKVLLDVGQAAMFAGGSLIAIFLGIGLVSREIERRTIYVIVAKPVSRGQFLVGKAAGLTLTLTVAMAVMAMTLAAVTAIHHGAHPTVALAQSLVLLWAEQVLLVTLAVTFASFTSTHLAAMFSFCCWLIGMVVGDLKELAARTESPVSRGLLEGLYWLFPDLGLFYIADRASYEIPLPWDQFAYALGYGAAYTAALLCLSVLVFSRRDFR